MATSSGRSSATGALHAAGARHASHLRALNLDRVLSVVMARTGTFTRAELSDATGLSAPTVGGLAQYLIGAGLIADLGAGPSRGGRRPSRMEFKARYGFVAGIDLGTTRTRLAIANLGAETVAHRIVSTPTVLSPEGLLTSMATSLKELARDAGVPFDRVIAVPARVPGPGNSGTAMVPLRPNLPGSPNLPMRMILLHAI